MRDRVIFPARAVVKMIDNCFREDDGPTANIRQGERLLQTWRPGDPVADLTMYLSRTNDDLLRHLRDQITLISTQYEAIEAEGKAYVASGEPVPEVVVMLDENIRQGLKADLITKGYRDTRPTHASGMGQLDPQS
jgi:hypothetical protein